MHSLHVRYLSRRLDRLGFRRPGAAPQSGFTAIELMVTVAILAVLAALAAPSFTPLMERWRVRQAAEELQSTIYYARSEAIKRGGGVTIQANAGDWNGGWQVTHTVNSTTSDLQNFSTPGNTSISLKVGSTNSASISVDRWGMLSDSGTPGTVPPLLDFYIQPQGKTNSPNASHLCVRPAGRIERTQNNSACPT